MNVIIVSYRFFRNMWIFWKDLLTIFIVCSADEISACSFLCYLFSRLIYLRISYTVSVIWGIYNFIQHIIINMRNIADVS
jgi:hypothetical protein